MKMATKPQVSAGEACNETRAIYQALTERPIERSCMRRKECCHFKLTGRTPLLTKGEAILAAAALRRNGRTRLPSAASGVCPMLNVAPGDCLILRKPPIWLPDALLCRRRRSLRAFPGVGPHSPAGRSRSSTRWRWSAQNRTRDCRRPGSVVLSRADGEGSLIRR